MTTTPYEARPVALIETIGIRDGYRRARVTDPATGERRYHGLGAVGEPIGDYLGDRAEGYSIDLPDWRDIRVFEVDFDAPPRRDGTPAIHHLSVGALGAPDFTGEEA